VCLGDRRGGEAAADGVEAMDDSFGPLDVFAFLVVAVPPTRAGAFKAFPPHVIVMVRPSEA
jgi:hypothetical protein